MALVKSKDKRTGITYVYESESYWDKEKKQPRNRRKLIGRLDEETGNVVPTDGRGHKRGGQSIQSSGDTKIDALIADLKQQLVDKDQTIHLLEMEVKRLTKEKNDFYVRLDKFVESIKRE